MFCWVIVLIILYILCFVNVLFGLVRVMVELVRWN